MAHTPITADRLGELARLCDMTVAPAEEDAYLALLKFVGEVVDGLEDLPPTPIAAIPAVRTDYGRPSPERDPLNAILRLCDVRAARSGLLDGLNLTVKDSLPVGGVPMTVGASILENQVSDYDCVVVERLLAAGARIVATTNMDAFGMSGGGESGFAGPVRCPHDPLRSAGGSSGGAAASLFYDGIDGALGTDQGGSVRVPSAWCGVIGLKPTHGLVPYTGAVSLEPSLDHIGPIARSVGTIARLLQAIADSGGADYLGAVRDAPQDLRGRRIGIVRQGLDPSLGTDQATIDAVARVKARFKGLGGEVTEIDLPEHLQAGPIVFAITVCGVAGALAGGSLRYPVDGVFSTALAASFADGLKLRAENLSHQTRLGILAGLHLNTQSGGLPFVRARALRPWLTSAYDRALDGLDAIMLPTVPHLPYVLEEPMTLRDRVLRGWGVLGNTMATDVTGHPAISLPLEQDGGLPIGMMLIGRPFAEAGLLGLSRTLESALGWAPAASPAAWAGPCGTP